MADVEFIDAFTSPAGAADASALFTATFGSQPAGVWSAPGRVNIIGEHTDYNAGLCLPIALPHRTFIAVSPREDTVARVVSSVNPSDVVEVDLDGLAAGGVDGWGAYPIGVAWALREAGMPVRGFDAAFVSCVPFGSGLSSSAAMTCSTALALDETFGLGYGQMDAGRVTLVEAAIRAENEMARAATGGMDQSASLRSQEGFALLLDFRPELTALENAQPKPFDLEAHGLELVVIDTQAQHSLNDGQYEERRRTCEEAAEILGAQSLRVTADSVAGAEDSAAALAGVLEQLPSEVMVKRVRHVVTEIQRVRDFVTAFGRDDIAESGRLLNASHDSLATDYEVTVPELDVAVEVARGVGAYGARMTGGGFGGSIIALVDKGRARETAQAVAGEFAARGFHAPRALVAYPARSASRDR